MNMPQLIARQLHEVYFGGNWTTTNLRDSVQDVTWQQAMAQVNGLNTIATLVYHSTYFVTALLDVLSDKPLTASDRESFIHPPIACEEDWQSILTTAWLQADKVVELLKQLPEEKLAENFSGDKYGTYYRNIAGITEHLHYHLGQIVLIKKLLREQGKL
ncbi:MAG TPA: DinB family protein [Chitinophagales bacterium]|nr:DinB family protein [Chitinophagales bacterium]